MCFLGVLELRVSEALRHGLREHLRDCSKVVRVMEDFLTVHYQSEDHILRVGDSVNVDAPEAHSYCGQSENPVARAVIITTSSCM